MSSQPFWSRWHGPSCVRHGFLPFERDAILAVSQNLPVRSPEITAGSRKQTLEGLGLVCNAPVATDHHVLQGRSKRHHLSRLRSRQLGHFTSLETQKLTSCWNLCNLNFDVIAEAADAACELGHDTAGIAASEVVGAEVLVTSAVGQHVIGGLQDRCRDRDDGFLWTTPGLEPQVLRLEVAVLLFGRCVSALHKDWLQPGRPLLDACGAALSGALVQTGDKARPR